MNTIESPAGLEIVARHWCCGVRIDKRDCINTADENVSVFRLIRICKQRSGSQRLIELMVLKATAERKSHLAER